MKGTVKMTVSVLLSPSPASPGREDQCRRTLTPRVGGTPFLQRGVVLPKSLPRQGLGDSSQGVRAAVLKPLRSRGPPQKDFRAAAERCTFTRFWDRRMGTPRRTPRFHSPHPGHQVCGLPGARAGLWSLLLCACSVPRAPRPATQRLSGCTFSALVCTPPAGVIHTARTFPLRFPRSVAAQCCDSNRPQSLGTARQDRVGSVGPLTPRPASVLVSVPAICIMSCPSTPAVVICLPEGEGSGAGTDTLQRL